MARTWKKCRFTARPAGILAGTEPDTGWFSGSARRLGPSRVFLQPEHPAGLPIWNALFRGMFWSGARTRYTQIAVCCSTDELSKGDGIEPSLLACRQVPTMGAALSWNTAPAKPTAPAGSHEPQRNDKTGRAYRRRNPECRAGASTPRPLRSARIPRPGAERLPPACAPLGAHRAVGALISSSLSASFSWSRPDRVPRRQAP